MAEEITAATETEQPAEQPAPAPEAQPETDWEAKYKGAIDHARLWEDRARANVEKAKAYDELLARADADAAKAADAQQRAEAAEAEVARMTAERERRNAVDEIAAERGVDASVLAAMRAETREELETAADLIATAMQQRRGYPIVHDGGATAVPPVTREAIESIKNPEQRILERARNIAIYK